VVSSKTTSIALIRLWAYCSAALVLTGSAAHCRKIASVGSIARRLRSLRMI